MAMASGLPQKPLRYLVPQPGLQYGQCQPTTAPNRVTMNRIKKARNDMTIKKHPASHTDHLTPAQLSWVLSLEVPNDNQVRIQTLRMPDELGSLECGLYGPAMGDEPVTESLVLYGKRPGRSGESRLCRRGKRPTQLVTVVTGPHRGETGVLYTAYGGPEAPRELFDVDTEEGRAFWAEHALAIEPGTSFAVESYDDCEPLLGPFDTSATITYKKH